MGVRLSEDDAWRYVAESGTAIVTTLRRDGFPVALPLWFTVLDRELYVRTPARSKKVARVRHDDRAGVLVESGEQWAELKAVSFAARAGVVEDDAVRAQVLEQLGVKYRDRRASRSTLPTATVQHYDTGAAIIRLTPVGKLLTWDNSRIEFREPGP
jgi:nitroimidazol reductase NimA-like FMN-containing flavoprotein (pyridoxamine 5'-phosphate oxidase superfamily)